MSEQITQGEAEKLLTELYFKLSEVLSKNSLSNPCIRKIFAITLNLLETRCSQKFILCTLINLPNMFVLIFPLKRMPLPLPGKVYTYSA